MDWVQRKRWEWLRIVGWLDPGCLDPCSREEEPGLVWGKFGGPCACGGTFSYFLAPPNFFGKSFLFESNVAKEGLPRDDPSGLGTGGLSAVHVRLGPAGNLPGEQVLCFVVFNPSQTEPQNGDSPRTPCIA